jgi:hypothetical protein
MFSRSNSGNPVPWLIGGTVAALFLGAAYLYMLRGTALLLDLAAAAGGLFCF